MKNLWNDRKQQSAYIKDDLLYQNHLIEQYKLYVEMADRISSRRNLANVFFLSLNTSIVGAIGFGLEKLHLRIDLYTGALFMFTLTSVLVVWWWLLRSYRNLSAAKFKIIGQIEELLPTSPWRAEWDELNSDKLFNRHMPFSYLESSLPLIFFFIYLSTLFLYSN